MNLALVVLTITNLSGAPARIAELRDKCDRVVVAADKPVHLKNGESVTFKVTPVIHTYTVCGSGFCSSSALGFKRGHADGYVVTLVLDGVYIDAKQEPDHWVGNKECFAHGGEKS